MALSRALQRLAPAGGGLTIGIDLPLDNDWRHGPGTGDGIPDLRRHAELATLADRLGFAALWVRDVPLFDRVRFGDAGTVFETFAHLGHLAAITTEAVLGTAAVVLPLRAGLLTAKAAATVDVLSSGRLVLGVASGDRPVEYPLFGVDFQQRGALFRQSVEHLRAAWSRPAPGQGIAVPSLGLDATLEIDVLPKPVGPGVPLVVAGKAQQSLEWIAGNADGWFNYPRDLDGLTAQLAAWHRLTRDAGTDKPYLMPLMLDLVADPVATPEPIFHGLRTGREALLDHIEELRRRGVRHLSLSLRHCARPVDEVLHELAETVLPNFHPARAAAQA